MPFYSKKRLLAFVLEIIGSISCKMQLNLICQLTLICWFLLIEKHMPKFIHSMFLLSGLQSEPTEKLISTARSNLFFPIGALHAMDRTRSTARLVCVWIPSRVRPVIWTAIQLLFRVTPRTAKFSFGSPCPRETRSTCRQRQGATLERGRGCLA